jgi:hypothetical protein
MDQIPVFTNDKGEPYRLFIHSCPEKERITNLIEVSEHNLEIKCQIFYIIMKNANKNV